jgi:hypothetical protein
MRVTGPATIVASLALTLGLPAIGALAMAGRTAPRPVVEPVRPGLAFDQYLVDLDEIAPTAEITARFGFANSAKTPVQITKWEPSCGCLKPSLRKTEYQPFESGFFTLKIRTAGETPGPHEYRMVVSYNDPEPRQITLTFRVKIPEQQIFVRPRAVMVYQNGKQATSHEVTVTDLRSKPATVLAAKCSSNLVTAEIATAETTTDGHREQKVKLTIAADVPTGNHWSTVTLFTDDSQFPELIVPVQIMGNQVFGGAPTSPLVRRPGRTERK